LLEPNNTLNPSAKPQSICFTQGSVVRAQIRFKPVARDRIRVKSVARTQIGVNKKPVFACKPVITVACFFISTHSIQKKYLGQA
jgi:hypothetical protein